jgi:pyridoxamine 5'-phosphate oxidase-like protein
MTAITTYVTALAEPTEEHIDALRTALADDVVVVGMFGPGEGLDAVQQSLRAPQRFLDGAQWGTPETDGATASVDATFAPGTALAGVRFHITLDAAGRVARVEQEVRTAPRPPATPLALTDDIKRAVDGALANGTPMVLAYVDEGGEPHLSLRGTTQVFSDTQLAIWVRDRGGGLLKALPANPRVALFYRDPATRTTYQFAGRAHVDEGPAVRDAVYRGSPPPERNLDARRLGAAVVVDLDGVEGTGPGGRFRMERA